MEETKSLGSLTPATRRLGEVESNYLPMPANLPNKLGPYKLVKELGRGGMGVVYKAWDENLERTVAIKIISPALGAFPDAIERLKTEAKAVAQLNHQNIVAIYAFAYEENFPYIVMEFVEGRDLGEVVKRLGPVEVAAVVKYMRQAAEALRFAAERKIIHRDIKPANLFLTNKDELKVMDFGLARRLDAESNLTITGNTVGTPSYMSPEQVLAKELDHRSDMYSLACTLFTLLSGHQPFSASSAMEIMMKHVNSPIVFPAEWKKIARGKLLRFLERMTRKEPAERYQTWDEAVAALDEIAGELQGSAILPSGAAKKRAAPLMTAIAAGVLIVGTGAGLAAWFMGGNEKPLPLTPITNGRTGQSETLGPADTASIGSFGSNTPNTSATPAATPAPTPRATAPPPPETRGGEENIRAALSQGLWDEALAAIDATPPQQFSVPGEPMPAHIIQEDLRFAIQAAQEFEREHFAQAGSAFNAQERSSQALQIIEEKGMSMSFLEAWKAVVYLTLLHSEEALRFATFLLQSQEDPRPFGKQFAVLHVTGSFLNPQSSVDWRVLNPRHAQSQPGTTGQAGGPMFPPPRQQGQTQRPQQQPQRPRK